MSAIQVSSSVKQLLSAVRQLSEDERRAFDREFMKMQGQVNGSGHKSKDKRADTEAELIARIRHNSRLPETSQRRFNLLRRKLQDETISEPELDELQGLWSRVEGMNVERLETLIELSRLRKTDVKTLMSELGLNKKRNVF